MFIQAEVFFVPLYIFTPILESLSLHFFLFFLSFTVLYFLCKPIVKLLIRMHTTFLLNYLVTSFLFLFILLLISYFLPSQHLSDSIYRSLFISLIIFACILLIRRVYLQIMKG